MDDRTLNERVGATVMGMAYALWVLALLVVNVLIVGLFLPVVREHCTAGGGVEAIQVESGWRLGVPPWINEDKLVDDGASYCVRNTLTRELLSLVGVWPLGDPKEQVEDSIVDQATLEGGKEAGSYASDLLKLRRQSEVASRTFQRKVRRADTPEEVLAAFEAVRASQLDVANTLRGMNPPPSLREFNKTAIRLNRKSAEAADEVIAAIRLGTQSEIEQAFIDYETTQRELLQEFNAFSEQDQP